MTLAITPDMIAAAYDFLLTTPPFRSWGNMPNSEDIKFRVIKTRKAFGFFRVHPGRPWIIAVSAGKVGNAKTLLETVAHEMIHLHDELVGVKASHGPSFIRKAALVCKHHDFDPKTF